MTTVHNCTRWIHQVHISHGKPQQWGRMSPNVKTFLEKRYTDDMELDDTVHTAILTLKEGFEGQISGNNIEIGIISRDRKFRVVKMPPSSLTLLSGMSLLIVWI